MDLNACIEAPMSLQPGRVAAVPTGIAIALPDGYEAQVRPRSGLALHQQVTVLNTPGTVDSDYRGEIAVVLANFGDAPFVIMPGARIAQLVIAPVVHAIWVEREALGSTARSDGGFGSTGTD
jgi:dUTP pyrophosphatase